jgi:hypothetical protein
MMIVNIRTNGWGGYRKTGVFRQDRPGTVLRVFAPPIFARQTLSECCSVRKIGIKGFPHMLIGYMRVSSSDDRQSVDLQRDALIAVGIDERHLHQDKASGARDDRPGLKSCLGELRSGDTLVVWKLDRLGRSLSHLIQIVEELKQRGIAFRSLTEEICTISAHGVNGRQEVRLFGAERDVEVSANVNRLSRERI